jgi:hypothetical protein
MTRRDLLWLLVLGVPEFESEWCCLLEGKVKALLLCITLLVSPASAASYHFIMSCIIPSHPIGQSSNHTGLELERAGSQAKQQAKGFHPSKKRRWVWSRGRTNCSVKSLYIPPKLIGIILFKGEGRKFVNLRRKLCVMIIK